MKKSEQAFHSKLVKYLRYNASRFPHSYLFETKVAREGKKRFPLRELSDKERMYLKQAKHSKIIQTHSDESRRGTICDGSVICGGGLIFLHFTKRANKVFYCLDIDILEAFEKDNNAKSITEKEAEEIASQICELA